MVVQNHTLFFIIIGVFALRLVEWTTPVPEYGKVLYNLGVQSEKINNYNRALGYHQKAIGFNPNLVEAYHHIGIIYYKRSQYDQAIGYLQKAINLDPQYHPAYYTLGQVYRSLGDYEMALKFLKEALSLYHHYPYTPVYTYDVGMAYLDVGDKVNAADTVGILESLGEHQLAEQLKNAIAQIKRR